MNSLVSKGLAFCVFVFVVSCSVVDPTTDIGFSSFDPASDKALLILKEARLQSKSEPDNISLLMQIRQKEVDVERYYISKAKSYLNQSDFETANYWVDVGLGIVPESKLLLSEKTRATNERMVHEILVQAGELAKSERYTAALQVLKEADNNVSNDTRILALRNNINESFIDYNKRRYRVDLNFKDLPVKKALEFIAGSYGINVIFDTSVKETSVSFSISDVSFYDAIDILTSTTKNSYKVLNESTLLVYADTKDRHNQFDPISIKTFFLETIQAKDLAKVLKSVVGSKNITINEAMNSLIVRDTPASISLVERIVQENDVSPGEVVLNVEILEVNTNKSKRLGIDYGNYQISTVTPALSVRGSIERSYNELTTLNLPNISLNAFKQAVDAKSLARPSIRVLDGEKAKIHIGDRVPLRTANIQDATGQTRTTFEYQEIGIRLNVEADIHSSDKVTVIVQLEVSSLGENLGTATEQAFRIGTRNADTTMLLSSGETAIIGGLLRDESRSTGSGVSGLSALPYIGRLFGSEDQSKQQTELLLTVTPVIVRQLAGNNDDSALVVGTEKRLALVNTDLLKLNLKASSSSVEKSESEFELKVTREQNANSVSPLETKSDSSAQPIVSDSKAFNHLKFMKRRYSSLVGGETIVSLDIRPEGLGSKELEVMVTFSDSITSFVGVRSDKVDSLNAQVVSNKGGVAQIRLILPEAEASHPTSVNLRFKNARKGTSYITAKFGEVDAPITGSMSVASTKVVVD